MHAVTTMTEAESLKEARRLRKRAKERPDDPAWTSHCELAAAQTRTLFLAEVGGDEFAAGNLRESRAKTIEWIKTNG